METDHQKRLFAIDRAVYDGYTKAAIARAIGTTTSNFNGLITRIPKNSKFIQPMDAWLKEHGFWPGEETTLFDRIGHALKKIQDPPDAPPAPTVAPSTPPPGDALAEAAKLLHHLANLIEAEHVPLEDRLKIFDAYTPVLINFKENLRKYLDKQGGK